jgi:hypothetical protein
MLYQFKSRQTGTVTMTREVAESMLEIIGKSPGPQGIISVDQMPAAIASLERAVARQGSQAGADMKDDEDGKPVVGLGQRAFPFIEMLKAALAAKADVTWGV